MLSAFSEERVEFLVVDAYALAVHGLPRATGDMDLWVRQTLGNARRVRAALARFGAPIEGLSEADLITPGTSSRSAYRRAASTWRVDGLEIPMVGRTELIRNKKATERAKDLADAAWLEGREV